MNKSTIARLALACAFMVAAANLPAAEPNKPARYTPVYSNVKLTDQKAVRHPVLASDSKEAVGVQLVIATDTSTSMEPDEYEIQIVATANALNSEQFRNAIKYKSGENSVAIAVIDFESFAMLRVPWVDIRGDEINDKPYNPENPAESSAAPDKLDKLAAEIMALPRWGRGGTSLSQALKMGGMQFEACPWKAKERKILDIFSDGRAEAGEAPSLYMPLQALASIGVTVNAFAVVSGEDPDLDDYYRENLVTQGYMMGPDGVYSEPGRVWAVTRSVPKGQAGEQSLRAYFNDVAKAMARQLAVEVARLETGSSDTLALVKQKDYIPR